MGQDGLDEQEALLYVNDQFPRIEALVSVGEELSKRRRYSYELPEVRPALPSPDVFSDGEAEVRVSQGKKRGRKPKYKGSPGNETGAEEKPKPARKQIKSVIRMQQEEMMNKLHLDKEKYDKTATKLADFLQDPKAWAGLEPNGQTHKEFFDFLQHLRMADPGGLKVKRVWGGEGFCSMHSFLFQVGGWNI